MDSANFYGSVEASEAADVARAFDSEGWSVRRGSWTDFEVRSNFAELVVGASRPVLIHGPVMDVAANWPRIVRPLAAAGFRGTLECYDEGGELLIERSFGHGGGDGQPSSDPPLQSGVLTSPAEPMLSRAIAETLAATPSERHRLFAQLIGEIVRFMAAHPEERPWTCTVYEGTDGSVIFRGGVGHSLVVDPSGRLWRARSYEDFETRYRFGPGTCEIDALTPIYSQMREYLPR